MGVRYVFTRTGPMAIGINQGGMFARTDPALNRPDVQFHLATLSSDMAGSPVHTFSGFTMSVCQLRPNRAARAAQVARPARGAGDAAQLSFDARSTARRSSRGIRLAWQAAATRALEPYVAGEYRPGGGDDRRRSARVRAATRAPRSSTRPARARWVRRRTRWPWSIPSCRVHGLEGIARRRLPHHAHACLRQHQRAGDHDRREGGRHDPADARCRELQGADHALLPRRFRLRRG